MAYIYVHFHYFSYATYDSDCTYALRGSWLYPQKILDNLRNSIHTLP